MSLTLTMLCYAAYRSHDDRVLSNEEVAAARDMIAQIAPPSNLSSKRLAQTLHMNNLNKLGVTVVKDTLSTPQVQEWITKTKAAQDDRSHNVVWNSGRAHCSISKRSMYYNDMARIGAQTEVNTSASPLSTSIAQQFSTFMQRWLKKNNCNVSHQTDITEQTTASQINLQQIAKSYFEQHNISRYELTDVQFLNAHPNKSTNQIWHRDNKFRGLTAIVALKDIRGNGPTELILGSQSPDYTLTSSYWMALRSYLPSFLTYEDDTRLDHLQKVPIKPLLACIDAGDAVLYDARIFHRGRTNNCNANSSEETDRPVLVLRWDAARTPPPGAGLVVTNANIYWGTVLYAGLYLLEKLKPSDSSSD